MHVMSLGRGFRGVTATGQKTIFSQRGDGPEPNQHNERHSRHALAAPTAISSPHPPSTGPRPLCLPSPYAQPPVANRPLPPPQLTYSRTHDKHPTQRAATVTIQLPSACPHLRSLMSTTDGLSAFHLPSLVGPRQTQWSNINCHPTQPQSAPALSDVGYRRPHRLPVVLHEQRVRGDGHRREDAQLRDGGAPNHEAACNGMQGKASTHCC